MEDALVLETTFLIDLERELARGEDGPALRFLESHPRHRLFITPTISGELAAGTSLADRMRWQRFLQTVPIPCRLPRTSVGNTAGRRAIYARTAA